MAEQADLGVIDLTKVAAPDIRVKTRRADDSVETWRIPGNAPSGLMVELMVLLREVDQSPDDDIELIADLRAQIQEKVDELFALRNKDYEDGDVKLGDEELGTLVAGLFQRYYGGNESGGGDRPTVPEEEPEAAEEEPSTSATPPRPRSERRSRASSRSRKAPSRSSTSSPT